MLVTLPQEDIEVAIRNHIKNLGVQQEVEQITFNSSRKGGFSIEAEVEINTAYITGAASSVPVSAHSTNNIVVRRNAAVMATTEESDVLESTEPVAKPSTESEPEPVNFDTENSEEEEEVEEKTEAVSVPTNLFAQ